MRLHDDGSGLGLLPLRVVSALVRTRRRQADVGMGHGKRAVIALEIVDQAGVFPCRGQVSVRERLRPLQGFRENGAVAVDPQFVIRDVQRAGRLSDFLSLPLEEDPQPPNCQVPREGPCSNSESIGSSPVSESRLWQSHRRGDWPY